MIYLLIYRYFIKHLFERPDLVQAIFLGKIYDTNYLKPLSVLNFSLTYHHD